MKLLFEGLCSRLARVLARLSLEGSSAHHVLISKDSELAESMLAARIAAAAARIARELLSSKEEEDREGEHLAKFGNGDDEDWEQLLLPWVLSRLKAALAAIQAEEFSFSSSPPPPPTSKLTDFDAIYAHPYDTPPGLTTLGQYYVVIYSNKPCGPNASTAIPYEQYLSQDSPTFSSSSCESESDDYAEVKSPTNNGCTIWNVNAAPWWPNRVAIKKNEMHSHRGGKHRHLQSSNQSHNQQQQQQQSQKQPGTSALLQRRQHKHLSLTVPYPVTLRDTPEPPRIRIRHIHNPTLGENEQIAYRELYYTPTMTKASQADFSIMSWNILSPRYCTQRKYPNITAAVAAWPERRLRVFREVIYYGADIVCLQEVDEEDFYGYFGPEMRRYGYEGVYARKKHEHIHDGCATFVKARCFKVQAVDTLHYNSVDLMESDDEFSSASSPPSSPPPTKGRKTSPLSRSLDSILGPAQRNWLDGSSLHRARACRYNLGTGQSVRVANTHLLADPLFAGAKLLQTAVLVDHLQRTASGGIIICGDFNSLPQSAVSRYLLDGCVHRKEFWGSDFGKFTRRRKLRHSLSLRSVYDYSRGDLRITTQSPDFAGCVDYVLYGAPFKVTAYLGDISTEGKFWMPNEVLPSDHLPLLSHFSLAEPRRPSTARSVAIKKRCSSSSSPRSSKVVK